MRQTVLKADEVQHRQENRRGYALLSHTTYLQVHDEIPVLFASDIRNRTDEASFAQPMLNPYLNEAQHGLTSGSSRKKTLAEPGLGQG